MTPHVFWLCGLSGAGKSTLADRLTSHLRAKQRAVLALDGDVLRSGLCRDLGFSDADRTENLRRAAELARLAACQGMAVVVACITPLNAHRRLVADIVGRPHLSLIYLDAPLAVCRQRDVKGLYARALDGAVPLMTGVSSAFEPPTTADLVIPTEHEDVEASWQRLRAFAASRT